MRVPFNAIVLGIEQMELELREHYAALPGALDTLGIISEQSQVVSRILNDVLSKKKKTPHGRAWLQSATALLQQQTLTKKSFC